MRESVYAWAKELTDKYYNYYCTVATGFIVQAITDAEYDGYEWRTVDELHKIVVENYI